MLAVCGGSHDNGNSSVIVSLDGSRLFVANAGNNSVSVFSVDRNGANPTPLATSTTGVLCQRHSRLQTACCT